MPRCGRRSDPGWPITGPASSRMAENAGFCESRCAPVVVIGRKPPLAAAACACSCSRNCRSDARPRRNRRRIRDSDIHCGFIGSGWKSRSRIQAIRKRARARLGLPMRLWVPGRSTGRRQLGEACRLRRSMVLCEPVGARPQLAGTRGALRWSAMHDRAAGRDFLPVPVTGRRPLSEAARSGARSRNGIVTRPGAARRIAHL